MNAHSFLARKSKKSSYTREVERLHTSGIPREPKSKRKHVCKFVGGRPIETRMVTKHNPAKDTLYGRRVFYKGPKMDYMEVVKQGDQYCRICRAKQL